MVADRGKIRNQNPSLGMLSYGGFCSKNGPEMRSLMRVDMNYKPCCDAFCCIIATMQQQAQNHTKFVEQGRKKSDVNVLYKMHPVTQLGFL